jgi:hypothetical protein
MANVAELVVKIVADTKDAQNGVDDVSKKAGGMSGALSKAALPAAAALTAVAGAAIAAGKAAAEDEQAQAVLATTLKNTTGATDAQIKAVEDHIAAMSLATGVADDELRPAMGNLMRATGDVATSQDALAVALDVAAATGKSVESVTNAMSKGYGGSAASLKKLVPSLSEASVESADMTAIMAELAEVTGGAAAASADTAAGQMKVFQNAMGEAQEEAGSALIPIMSKLADILVVVAKWIGENTTLFVVIAGVIATVAAAILIANAAIAVYNTVTTIAGIVSTAAWGAALLPITLVIVAVLAVVAAVVLLWKKSETFRTVVTAVWNAIKAAVEFVTDAVGELIRKIGSISVPGFIKTAFDNIRDAVENLWNWVGKIIEKIGNISVPGAIRTAFENIRDAIEAAWNWAGNLITKIGNISVPESIKNAFGDVKAAIEGAWNRVGDLIAAIGRISVPGTFTAAFNTLKTAIDNVINAVENLIGWLSRIHVPKINLPGGNMVTPAPEGASVVRFAAPGVPSTTASSSTGGRPISIVVNGALDPEATARQIRRILAGHDRRVGLVGA